MNNTSDITRIRTLLNSYYDGSISPQERKELSDMLIAANSLPEDIETEKEIYLSIENPEEIHVPEYLSQRIEHAISTASPRRKPFRWQMLYYASAAAAVILLFSMIWNAVDITDTSMEIPENRVTIMAEYTSDETKPEPSHIPVSQSAAEKEDTDKQEFSQVKSASHKQLAAAIPSTSKTKSKGNVRVVTDPDEAAHILDCVMGILTENMYTAERACDKPDIIIESMNHTLSKTDL